MNRFIRLAFAIAFLYGLSIVALAFSGGALGNTSRPGSTP